MELEGGLPYLNLASLPWGEAHFWVIGGGKAVTMGSIGGGGLEVFGVLDRSVSPLGVNVSV